MAPSLLTLLDPGQPILYTAIFGHLGVMDTVNLLAACHRIRALKKHVFNVNVLLRPFFKDPIEFRQLMADNDLIIGGSMALRLFSRESWSSSDVDIYTEYVDSISVVGAFLEGEGYEFKPFFWQTEGLEESIQRADRVKSILWGSRDVWGLLSEDGSHTDFYGIEQIKDIYAFIHHKTNKKVELVLTRGSPFKLILSYYSTYLMNFFSYRAAYSIFPSFTFREKMGFYVPPQTGLRPKTVKGILKYHDRGYSFYVVWPEGHGHENYTRVRTVGDCDTWSIHFPIDGIKVPIREMRLQGTPFTVKFMPGSWTVTGNAPGSEGESLEEQFRAADYLKLELGRPRGVI
ncbi:hypothetical protein TWF281_003813 [Arthrobotrys megalospora]